MYFLINWRPETNLIKLFRQNLRFYRHLALIFNSAYVTRGVNYAQKSFVKLTSELTSPSKPCWLGRAYNYAKNIFFINPYFDMYSRQSYIIKYIHYKNILKLTS
jgi:hypothetical protein